MEQQKAAGHMQQDSEARVDEKEFMLSQTDPMNKNRKEGGVNEYDDEEEVDYEDSLENDKTAMKKLDAKFEERTSKVSKLLNIQKKESDWMEIDRKDMRTKIEMSGDEDEVDQFSIVSIKKRKVTLAARSSKTVEEKSSKILDKAMDKKRKRISSLSCNTPCL
jgi:glyceraldehyde-3-phosphate dehydrogenase/erythrose-4-phosphate dehydrogenase